MPLTTERTTFSLDVLGRYIANTWQEAMASADRGVRADARPFDVIVIGGGTFGAAFAQHLFARDMTRRHRILVLEGGPVALPEHVQNLPMLGVGVPKATSIEDLRRAGHDTVPREEVWGLPWHGNVKFPGLAYCVAGRSLWWGGWSPELLPAEMATWPAALRRELGDRFFGEAAAQLGVTESNDFLDGPLHTALRARVFAAVDGGQVGGAVPLGELPWVVEPPAGTPPAERQAWKLEAPLAVQARARPGFFPFNKFSAMPLLTKATRAAAVESAGDDVRKRLMVVTGCHVKRLLSRREQGGIWRIRRIETNLGDLDLAPHASVVLACGTIENTRLALVSFADPANMGGQALPNAALIGKNLMAHLRSNLTIRVPRAALGVDGAARALAASALFVKGRHVHQDGSVGHFHLQITASGLGAHGADSEAELFKKIPDLDGLAAFEHGSDSHVVITLRGIGEMTPHNANSSVVLDPEVDEYGVRRAFARLQTSAKDDALWNAMDRAAMDLAQRLAGGVPVILAQQRDGLGTTHHESGGLWLGDEPAASVTDPDGRVHGVGNAYVLGPALLPTIGSPNPMLTGIAMLRRTVARAFVGSAQTVEPDFEALFDGTATTFAHWRATGAGGFDLIDGSIVTRPGGDLGLLYYDAARFDDFTLRLEFRLERGDDNSGVFVRARDPRLAVPDPSNPGRTWTYANPAFVPVTTGFEVQIDELARDDGADMHRTGAVYGVPVGTAPGQQDYRRGPALVAGAWYELQIEVAGNDYTVRLSAVGSGAVEVTRFANVDPHRGKPSSADPQSGFVGIQAHSGRVSFRRIRARGASAMGFSSRAAAERGVLVPQPPTPRTAPGKEKEKDPTPRR